MTQPKITIGVSPHPRTQALIDKQIGVDGFDVEVVHDFLAITSLFAAGTVGS